MSLRLSLGPTVLLRPPRFRKFSSSLSDSIVARTSRLFINNEYVEAEGSARLPVVSPRDGQPFASIAHASPRDVDKAVTAARRCFEKSVWPRDVQARSAVLHRVAAALRTQELAEAFSTIESRDNGRPLAETSGDISFCADLFEYYAQVAAAETESTPLPLPEGSGDFTAKTLKEALGVVACITPWNYPLLQAVVKVAPALAAGCSLVLKPSPWASLTCCALGELFLAAGAPPGAFNVVTGGPPDHFGDGGSTGQSLIEHCLVDKISFTGSGGAGRKILDASAQKLRPASLELGGKSAFIVFEDAAEYMEAIVDWIMVGIFSCTGQICSATSRVLVHKSIEQQLLARLKLGVDALKVGDSLAPDTTMGPLVSAAQKLRVESYVAQARADGCTIYTPPLAIPSHLQSGFYVAPTVVTDVPVTAQVWKEEVFGPVLCIKSFNAEEEAIELANSTIYGLANTVYSADPARRARVVSQLKSGIVWENCSQCVFPSTPFGGRPGKASGFGHEYGLTGLREYLTEKTVVATKSPSFSFGSFIPQS